MAENPSLLDRAKSLADELKQPLFNRAITYRILLVVTEKGLVLQLPDEKNLGPVTVDFLKGAMAHRRQHGGGRNQLLARAVGLSNKKNLSVLDLTAGLGRDAFILAHLGCQLTMIERHPVIAALLEDGMARAKKEAWFQALNLTLIKTDAQHYLKNLNQNTLPDVIYLDPMYPERKKSALVKKEMRVLRELAGNDTDANECLSTALTLPWAKKRVVVKRPRLAPTLAGPEPTLVFSGKSTRFDVYL